MILNATSVIAGFLSLVQAGLAVSVVARSTSVLRRSRRASSLAQRDAAEVAALYPALQGGALIVVALVSWALLVAVLSSYVPVWPSVICIEGVTRIGTGTVGLARHLPALLDTLFLTKPMIVILGAVWLTVHAIQRRGHGPTGRGGTFVVAGLGALAAVDAVVELTYLGIPKEERFLSSGCCLITNVVFADTKKSWLEHLVAAPSSTVVVAGMAATALLLGITLVPPSRRSEVVRSAGRTLSAPAIALAIALSICAQHVALAIVSPRATGVSTHRCAWCVVEHMPLGALSFALVIATGTLVLLMTVASLLEVRVRSAGDAVSRALARGALVTLAAAAVSAALALC